jgi:HlyD family secretion protein
MKKVKWILGAAALVAVVVVIVKCTGGDDEVTFQTAVVTRGTIETTVMATGYVQPVDEVEVGTQVSGVIEKILVDYNSQVKKGDLLAQLETNTLLERVNQAKATLRSGQSDLDYARQNHERVKTLYESKAATQVSYEEAVNRLTQAETSLENAKAALTQAEVNLSYAYIHSPIDGVILDRAVNIGQTVAASFSTPTLFTIAEDLTKRQVEADVDEADIGQVRVGQPVVFTVDSYPDDTFTGTVRQMRLQPVVTSNVVTYTVIIDAPNPEEKLFPGMTASITITVASEEGLMVPVEAVNFMPGPELAGSVAMQGPPTEGDGVWVKSGESITRQGIRKGLGDGINFIAPEGVSEGQEVVLSAATGKNGEVRRAAGFMPGPPRGGPGGGPGGPR